MTDTILDLTTALRLLCGVTVTQQKNHAKVCVERDDLKARIEAVEKERDTAMKIATSDVAWKTEKARADAAEKERDDWHEVADTWEKEAYARNKVAKKGFGDTGRALGTAGG